MSGGVSTSWMVWALAAIPTWQKGDVAGEPQPPLPPEFVPGPARALTPEEELATFQVAPGLRVELVAAEPLVEAPVQAVYDGDGRLWVVEMRGYMRDVDGKDESAPLGRISVLHDDDGDGRMDRAVRFLDGLVLPRAVAPTRDGALVIAPPHVLFCRDTDGDGVADERTVVDTGIAGIASPEYGPNGLLPTLDNAFACARHDVRYRFVAGKWTKEAVASGGQWGIAEDDDGRILFNTNSNVLRGHLVPAREAALNPFLDASRIADVELAKDQSVRPIHPTTAVNRAYKAGWLVDGRITKADAVCGVLVERGGLFPADFRGDVFVCEPVGNLVHWLEFARMDGARSASPQPGARPLLASTDERFRPVNLASGPDGAVYVVDMQRGLLQHRQFLTTFLREQSLARGLVEPLDRGRIWRVAPVDAKRERVPPLSTLSSDELLPYLGHANAFLRREAQRHCAEDDWYEAVVLPKLRAVVTSATNPLARIHALWSLDGRGALDEATLVAAIRDADESVRLQALRAATGRAPAGDRLRAALMEGAGQPGAADPGAVEIEEVFRQRAAALALLRDPLADLVALERARGRLDVPAIRHALLLGSAGRGLEVLGLILPGAPARSSPAGVEALCRDLAAAIVREGRADAILGLLDLATAMVVQHGHAGRPLMEGALSARPRAPRRLRLERAPAGLELLAARTGALKISGQDEDAQLARNVLDALAWPGRADLPPEAIAAPLSTEELARFERGRAVYGNVCAACHQPSGLGAPGIAPPLRDSDYALGDAQRAAAIVLAGLHGPIEVAGRAWDLEMPAWNATDDELASVLTYLRREWGHTASPVTEADVRAARDRVRERRGPLDARALATWGTSGPLPGWRAIGDAVWTLEDGAIRGKVGGGKQSFLATERAYGDFVLEVDVKLLGTGNSGIQVRSHQKDDGRVYGYQIEIDPSERAWSGGLYDEGRRGWLNDLSKNDAGRSAFRKNEWNRYRIECQGPWIRAWVNGVATADWIDPLDLEGFVALQVHAGTDTDVLWRDLRIEDHGTRAWRPIPGVVGQGGQPERNEAGHGEAQELADGAVRVRVRGPGLVICARSSMGCFAALQSRWIGPGLQVRECGYHVLVGDLPLAEGQSWDDAHDVVISTWGDRIAVHVDGRSVVDVHDKTHAGGVVVFQVDSQRGKTVLERAEVLGAAAEARR
ncbi:MAG: DUF1080 domain-containing protein [Planctomycetota bacterium]|nr:DUF1080 domain-containing protein [Planctomycetota bacterium]